MDNLGMGFTHNDNYPPGVTGAEWQITGEKPPRYARKSKKEELIMELTEALKAELEDMTPEYQDKLAHLLNTASSMGAWGGNCGELAVVTPDGGVVMREAEAAPLSDK